MVDSRTAGLVLLVFGIVMFAIGFPTALLNLNQIGKLEFSWFLLGVIVGGVGLSLIGFGIMLILRG